MFFSNKLRNKLCRSGNKLGFWQQAPSDALATRIVENLLVPELVPELVAGKNR
jgi:hypothetical protein